MPSSSHGDLSVFLWTTLRRSTQASKGTEKFGSSSINSRSPQDRTSVIYTELPDQDGPTQSGATPGTPDTASSSDFTEHDQPSSHQPTGSAAYPDRRHFHRVRRRTPQQPVVQELVASRQELQDITRTDAQTPPEYPPRARTTSEPDRIITATTGGHR